MTASKEVPTDGRARVVWTAQGNDELRVDSLDRVTAEGARLVTDAAASPGDELRFDLLACDGGKLGTGLARVVRAAEGGGLEVAFLALGVNAEIVAKLVAASPVAEPPSRRGPPPLPANPVGPTPSAEARLVEIERDPFRPDSIPPEIEPIPVRRPGLIIGIDLGTTNTCACYVVDGRPTIIPSRTGTNTIPSMITFDPDGRWHVGQRAADRQVLHPLRTVYGSKRLVGRTFRAELAEELQQHFAYPLGEADGRRFGARIDNRVIPMDTIAARVLDEVRSSAEAHLGRPVEAAVITVPAYFTEVQRDAVRRAAKEANLVVHRIVNEPTAAAVAYGHKQPGQRARVAVWDFGGGTFDFSLVDVSDGTLEVLSTGGDNFIGGSDLDDLLASHLLAEFTRRAEMELEPDPQQIARLREAAETAKRALSLDTDHIVEIPEFTRDPVTTLRVQVTRQQFEELARPLVERTVAIAAEVMREVGLTAKDIDDVVLVGGTTRIPLVQQAVQELFGRRPSKRINPDEAVALGAALLADEIGASGVPALLDILPMSIGHAGTGARFFPIVGKNTRLPTRREAAFAADLLGNATIPLFQGESSDAAANEYLCSVIVEDRSLWENGRVILRLSFDEHCVMSVEARNAKNGKPLAARLDRSRPVEDVLRELGKFEGSPPKAASLRPPPSPLGRAFGRLFKLFGR